MQGRECLEEEKVKKKLSEMTLEELWALFPVILTAHDPRWKTWYREEAEHIRKCMGDIPVRRMEHIGSTAGATMMSFPSATGFWHIPRMPRPMRC